jgi:hypothetical protein
MMKKQIGTPIFILLVLVLAACDTGITQTREATPIISLTDPIIQTASASTPTFLPLAATTSPQPTIQIAITANPDQLVRWIEYENALASKLLFLHPPEDILCEWEILGQSGREVYVWAVCKGLPPAGRSEKYAPIASIPAVIILRSDGSIQSVEIPGNSSSYAEGVRRLFPINIQDKIFNRLVNIAEMGTHADSRRENLGPPLIVILATPQP